MKCSERYHRETPGQTLTCVKFKRAMEGKQERTEGRRGRREGGRGKKRKRKSKGEEERKEGGRPTKEPISRCIKRGTTGHNAQ